MKKHCIIFVFLYAMTTCLLGQFELRIEASVTEVQQEGTVTLTYFIKNTGPVRNIEIGLDRLGDYFFVLFQYADGEEIIWRDMSLPVAKSYPPPREFFQTGAELSTSVEVFWQVERPIFGEIGSYSIRMKWIGPDNSIVFSEPINIEVVAP